MKEGQKIWVRHWVGSQWPIDHSRCDLTVEKGCWWCVGYFIRIEGNLVLASSRKSSPMRECWYREWSEVDPLGDWN